MSSEATMTWARLAAREVVREADRLFLAGSFDEFDRKLPDVPVETLDSVVIMAWLMMAAQPKMVEGEEKLPHRPAFVERCRAELLRREPENIEGLMRGLDK